MRTAQRKFLKEATTSVGGLILLSLVLFIVCINPLIAREQVKSEASPPSDHFLSNPSVNVSQSNDTSNDNYWYVGASSNDPSAESNQGVSSLIQVRSQNISGVLSFWVSESFPSNLWAQVGYYLQNASPPIAFYQVWNLTDRAELVTGTEAVSTGTHLFSILLSQSNIWSFAVDGTSFGSYDMKANVSSSLAPIYAMSEEGYVAQPFEFQQVVFLSAIQTLKSGAWTSVSYANSFGDAWGIGGHAQNSLLGQNELVVGEGAGALADNSSLWD